MDYTDINDLKKELWNKNTELNVLINGVDDGLYELAEKKADAERELAKLKTKKIVELRNDSEPISIIKDKVKGLTANAKFDFEIAKAMWETRKVNIDRIKTAIETIRSLISIAKSEINLK